MLLSYTELPTGPLATGPAASITLTSPPHSTWQHGRRRVPFSDRGRVHLTPRLVVGNGSGHGWVRRCNAQKTGYPKAKSDARIARVGYTRPILPSPIDVTIS